MSISSIQDILPLVQMPSRYLGTEVNRIKQSWDDAELHVALAFPDLYEIATSHFGIQILYAMLNEQPDILAERVFAPATDMEAQLRQQGRRLCSLESDIPLNRFEIVGFSLLYELNYTNMINMLDLGGVEFYAHRRKEGDPFVIAGGPCTCNPEPVAVFFDAMVIGDGEAVILQMTNAWKSWRHDAFPDRKALLQRWSMIEGVYIPSFFDVADAPDGRQRLIPQSTSYAQIKRAVVEDLDRAPFPTAPIIPFGKPVHDRLRMEIARGCTRGCRFCQAGMIYRPVRERHPQRVLDTIGEALATTGYEDLSLLSLSTGDYSCITPLMGQIMDFGAKEHLALSLPSLRAGSLSPEMMALIRKVRKTGFTIAPEAGSQRLRDVINKNISEADIFATVENAFALGWKLIKLYFMIGLPTETQTDLDAIVAMVKDLKMRSRKSGPPARINVSIATFVPKPHTPFQWEAQIDLETANNKLNWLRDNLKLPGVQVKWQDPRVSVIEGVWSRGDRRLSKTLVHAWNLGCRFDGWSDQFDFNRWQAAFDQSGVDPQRYLSGRSEPPQPLPWDHIHIGVTRAYLIDERKRAAEGKITRDCRTGNCADCGVCDFDRIRPISYHKLKMELVDKVDRAPSHSASVGYRINFRKMGPARFLGHLEMVKMFIRSFRRAGLPLSYSQGFHPMPRLSFDDTLPMGMQSEDEWMSVTLDAPCDIQDLVARLQGQLVGGFDIIGGTVRVDRKPAGGDDQRSYHVELKDGFFNQNDLDWFFEQQIVNIERKRKKGSSVHVDLKRAVTAMQLMDPRNLRMTLQRDNQLTVRPAEVLRTVFNLSAPQVLTAMITKQKTTHV